MSHTLYQKTHRILHETVLMCTAPHACALRAASGLHSGEAMLRAGLCMGVGSLCAARASAFCSERLGFA